MKTIITNRKARYEYQLLHEFDAGLVLLGSEVKSLREGNATLTDSFIYIKDGEVWIKNLIISKYKHNHSLDTHNENRDKKLLLNKKEIDRISKSLSDTGVTVVPLLVFCSRNKIKVKIAIARGKKLFDKRETIKERDIKREISRASI